jgi:hypothetical protein
MLHLVVFAGILLTFIVETLQGVVKVPLTGRSTDPAI